MERYKCCIIEEINCYKNLEKREIECKLIRKMRLDFIVGFDGWVEIGLWI